MALSANLTFLNVCIYRLPLGRTVLWGRSHCPHCNRQIRAWENIPVVSWMMLRGRCAGCRASIGIQYPIVELVTGLLFAGFAWLCGPTLLLVHRPEAFAQAARLGFPLVLAGHTHGGQLALPGTGGQVNLARVVTNLTRGVYRSEASTLYVNRGLGVGGPALRVQCAREIALIELASQ